MKTSTAWHLWRPTLVVRPSSSFCLTEPHLYSPPGINLLQASSLKTQFDQVLHCVYMQGPSGIRFNLLLCWESCHISFWNWLIFGYFKYMLIRAGYHHWFPKSIWFRFTKFWFNIDSVKSTIPILLGYEINYLRTKAVNCARKPLTWCIIENKVGLL